MAALFYLPIHIILQIIVQAQIRFFSGFNDFQAEIILSSGDNALPDKISLAIMPPEDILLKITKTAEQAMVAVCKIILKTLEIVETFVT